MCIRDRLRRGWETIEEKFPALAEAASFDDFRLAALVLRSRASRPDIFDADDEEDDVGDRFAHVPIIDLFNLAPIRMVTPADPRGYDGDYFGEDADYEIQNNCDWEFSKDWHNDDPFGGHVEVLQPVADEQVARGQLVVVAEDARLVLEHELQRLGLLTADEWRLLQPVNYISRETVIAWLQADIEQAFDSGVLRSADGGVLLDSVRALRGAMAGFHTDRLDINQPTAWVWLMTMLTYMLVFLAAVAFPAQEFENWAKLVTEPENAPSLQLTRQ